MGLGGLEAEAQSLPSAEDAAAGVGVEAEVDRGGSSHSLAARRRLAAASLLVAGEQDDDVAVG